jgi:hypothetical protein
MPKFPSKKRGRSTCRPKSDPYIRHAPRISDAAPFTFSSAKSPLPRVRISRASGMSFGAVDTFVGSVVEYALHGTDATVRVR